MHPTEPSAAGDDLPPTRKDPPRSVAPPAADQSTAPTPASPTVTPRARQDTQQELQAVSQEIKATKGYEPPPAEAAALLAARRAGEAASVAAAAVSEVAEIKSRQDERDARSKNTNRWTKYGTIGLAALVVVWPKVEALAAKHENDNVYLGFVGIAVSFVSAVFLVLRMRPNAKADEPKNQEQQAAGGAPSENGKEG